MSGSIEFFLPLGLVIDGKVYRRGRMRLATTFDELELQGMDNVGINSRYRDIVLFARVIEELDGLAPLTAEILENLFEADFLYLQLLYEGLNGGGENSVTIECPKCGGKTTVNIPRLYENMDLYKNETGADH
jgi:hypothetical protein